MPGGLGGILAGAGGGNYVGGSIVRLLLDAAQFDAGLKGSEARLHAFGKRVSSVGRGMQSFGAGLTRNVTLPIVAAAAASTKMAIDYENAFTKIRANSNLTGKEITQLKDYVLELSGVTAKSPTELAEGLYFLASAGLDAAQVQQTLTMAAKASAAGLGEVGDIARLTANVLNAYADSGITAKKATDILTAAVREGTAEPEEFAEAMGRILPIASKANVGFEQIAASLAGLSNIGLDVNEGVTAMRGLLQSIFAPTDAAASAMADLGLTSDQLRSTLSEGGLLAAMQLLEKRSGGNIDTLRDLIPNVRSLTGQLGLTGDNAENVADSFDRVKNSTGSLDSAFKKTTKGEGFRYQKLLNDLRVTAIEFGEVLLPVLDDVVDGVRGVVEWFGNLSDGTKEAIVKWGLIAAALGPVVGLLGRIVRLGSSAVGIIAKVGASGAATAATTAATGAAGVAGGATAAAGALGAGGAAAVVGGTALLLGAGVAFAKVAGDQSEATKKAAAEITKYGVASEQAADALDTLGLTQDQLLNAADLDKLREQGKSYDSLSASEFYAAQAAEVLLKKHQEYVQLLTGAGIQSVRAFDKVTEGAVELTGQQRQRIAQLIGAHERLGIAISKNTTETTNNLLQVGDFDAAMKNLRQSLDEGARKNGAFGQSARSAAGSTSVQAEKVAVLNANLRGLPTRRSVTVSVEIAAAMNAVNTISSALSDLGSRILNLPSPDVPGRHTGGRARTSTVSANHRLEGGGPTKVTVVLDGKVLADSVSFHQGRSHILRTA